jgi:uncharacterized protein (DUF58 family)
MNATYKDLLKPEILNSISGLELVARIVVEGFMSGSNKSQTIGAGQEFSQYRTYEPGDDLRQLDWKMYARSERYFIKQAEIETNITVKFIIDASHSMSYSEDDMSKLQYGKVLTATLAYLARKQSDAFGLFTVNDKTIHALQPRFETQQFLRFLNELLSVRSEGSWKKNSALEHLFDHRGKEMIVFITDLYDENDDLLEFVARLKTLRNEVIVFHLMGQHEMKLDQEGAFTFEDFETKQKRKVDTMVARRGYVQRVAEWIKNSRLWMYERQINYYLVQINDPIENTLRDFLKVRKIINR